jgi:hypothetical protein
MKLQLHFLKESNAISSSIPTMRLNGLFNSFQPNDAMWRHTFHLSLICLLPSDSSSHLSTLS